MNYFKSFPSVAYRFGTENTLNAFQDVSLYVELIDEIKDNIDFYTLYEILEGERPDQLSQRLYGSPDYYWTFFLMNDKIRQQGWPLSAFELDTLIKKELNLVTLTTRDNISTTFKVGQTISGVTSTATGIIRERRLDFGQLIVSTTGTFLSNELILSTVGPTTQSATLSAGSISQYNSIHHWEDENGVWVDVDPSVGTSAIYTPVTYYDKYIADNDALRTMRMIKPQAINSVFRSFNEALSQ
jgi:hypothetical protein